jgi:hypothetical protein
MKVKNITKEKTFEPITLEITIESEDELVDLWHRLNLSIKHVNDNSDTSFLPPVKYRESFMLFDFVDNICDDMDLKKF